MNIPTSHVDSLSLNRFQEHIVHLRVHASNYINNPVESAAFHSAMIYLARTWLWRISGIGTLGNRRRYRTTSRYEVLKVQ